VNGPRALVKSKALTFTVSYINLRQLTENKTRRHDPFEAGGFQAHRLTRGSDMRTYEQTFIYYMTDPR